MDLQVMPLNEPLGALVHGWDPSQALGSNECTTIRRSLQEHSVLIFRGHIQPTDDQLVKFAECFGDLVKGSEWFGDIASSPEILRVNNLVNKDGVPEGTGASDSLEWHSDYSYVSTVGKESFLEAVELPSRNVPKTYFCSQYDAFDRLAKEGALFHHSYVSSPSCTPSRGAVLTGQYHWRLEGAGNLWSVFPDKFDTYPELIGKKGYATGVSSKGWGPGRTETGGRQLVGPRFKNFAAFLKQTLA